MTEQDPGLDRLDYFSDSGENPGSIAGEVMHDNNKVRAVSDLPIQVGRFGKLRTTIEGYTGKGLSVGVQFAGKGKVRMLVAEHPDLIKKTAAVVGVTGAAIATGAVVYMHEHHKRTK